MAPAPINSFVSSAAFAYTPTVNVPLFKKDIASPAAVASPQTSTAQTIQEATASNRPIASRAVSQEPGPQAPLSPAQLPQGLAKALGVASRPETVLQKATRNLDPHTIDYEQQQSALYIYSVVDDKTRSLIENYRAELLKDELEEEIPPPPPPELQQTNASTDVDSIPPPPPLEEDDEIPPPPPQYPPPKPTYTGSVPLPPPPEGYGSDTIKRPTPKISLPTPPNMPLPAIPDEDDLPPPPARAS